MMVDVPFKFLKIIGGRETRNQEVVPQEISGKMLCPNVYRHIVFLVKQLMPFS